MNQHKKRPSVLLELLSRQQLILRKSLIQMLKKKLILIC